MGDVRSKCGPSAPSVIAGDFQVMHHGFKQGSPFREGAQNYFRKQLSDALRLARLPASAAQDYSYDGFYAPFQSRVHEVLDRRLGYVSAYGTSDADACMKSSIYAGCIDWVYVRNLVSLRDERIMSAISEGWSDHNAVLVTLRLR